MTTLIKLGGSLITDKHKARAFRQDATRMIASQINAVWKAEPGLRLVIGHGSGSFGHYVAKIHQTATGVNSAVQWLGFTKVAEAALALSHLVLLELLEHGLPAMRFQPSSFIKSAGGQIVEMQTSMIAQALESGIVPVVHGDVALDSQLGGTIISTERIFAHLAKSLPVKRIILLGEVDGVLDAEGRVIPSVTPSSFDSIRSVMGRSSGIDVTGGMLQKVEEMVALVDEIPSLEVVIANGRRPNVLTDLMSQDQRTGTRITLRP
ncbi:MAG: isopentenyl phosphate kinase [Chloroflexi bacterium]|nr:isopentenyl phosphate kinase [Chloroflexota bacterium]